MKIVFMGRSKYGAQVLQWTVDAGQTVVGVVTDSHFSKDADQTTLSGKKLFFLL